jgi:diguanylate cyclase (GGDEF)-like protein
MHRGSCFYEYHFFIKFYRKIKYGYNFVKSHRPSLFFLLISLFLVVAIFPLLAVGYSALYSISQERTNFTHTLLEKQSVQIEKYQGDVNSVINAISSYQDIKQIFLAGTGTAASPVEISSGRLASIIKHEDILHGPHSIDFYSSNQYLYYSNSPEIGRSTYTKEQISEIINKAGKGNTEPYFLGRIKQTGLTSQPQVITTAELIYLDETNPDQVLGFIAINYTFDNSLNGNPSQNVGPLQNLPPETQSLSNQNIGNSPPPTENASFLQPQVNNGSEISILMDSSKQVIYEDNSSLINSDFADKIFPIGYADSGTFVKRINNQNYQISFLWLTDPKLVLIHLTPSRIISNLILPNQNSTITVFIICLFFILIIAVLGAMAIIRPLSRVTDSFKQIQDGTFNWNFRLQHSWLHEVDELIDLFNGFLEKQILQKNTEEALIQSEDKYRSLFEDSPIPLSEQDFSEVLQSISQLPLAEVSFEQYLSDHPQAAFELISKIRILDVNQATIKLYQGKNADEIINNLATIFQYEDVNKLQDELLHLVKRLRVYEQVADNYTIKGKKLTVLMKWTVTPGHEKTMDRVIVSTVDITEKNKTDQIQSAILKISQDANTVNTLQELYASIHAALSDLMPARNLFIARYDQSSGMLSFPYFVDQFDPPPDPHPFGRGWTEMVINSGKPVLISEDMIPSFDETGELTNMGSDPVCWLGVPLIVQNKTIGVIVVQSYDHDTRYTKDDRDLLRIVANQIAMAIFKKQTEEQLIFASTHDGLTDLYNRAYYEAEVSRLSAGRDEPVGVIMIDIDGLKYTNDTYGHAAGDILIKTTAKIIQQAFRVNDVVARIGGDEFAILLPVSDDQVTTSGMDRIFRLVEQNNSIKGSVQVGLSMGYSTTGINRTLADAIRCADQEMYKAKMEKKADPNSLIR